MSIRQELIEFCLHPVFFLEALSGKFQRRNAQEAFNTDTAAA